MDGMQETMSNLEMGIQTIVGQMNTLKSLLTRQKSEDQVEPPVVEQRGNPLLAIEMPQENVLNMYGGYSMKTIHTICSQQLKVLFLSKIPDYRFETAHMAWNRLVRDYPP